MSIFKRLMIVLLLWYPLFAESQYKINVIAKDGSFEDTVWTKSGVPDSAYRRVAGVFQSFAKINHRIYLNTDFIDGCQISITGGSINQFLKKASNADGDFSWTTIAGGGDLLAANNLSDLNSISTARTNLGLSTTANLSNSANKNFVTDAQLTVIGNTSGTNSGDNAVNSLYSGLVTNANHSGDATGSTALTLATVNSNVGSFGSATQVPNYTVNGKGLITAAANTTIQIAESQVTSLTSDLALKAPLASPAFTGTPTGITATHVGLGNVTNESKATMFTNPAFTGTPTGIGIPVWFRVTGSNATTTGQSLVTITGLSASLLANATYEVECMLSVSTTAVTTGTGYGINYSAAGATIEGFVQGSSTSSADKTLRLSAFNTSSQAWLTTSAQTGGILIKSIVTVGANAGTLTAQHLKVTSGTSTVFIGSYLKITRIL